MHLELDDASRLEAKCRSGRRDLRVRAGSVGRDGSRRHTGEIGPAWTLGYAGFVGRRIRLMFRVATCEGRNFRVRLRAVVHERMMNDSAIAGPDLDRFHPLRFGEAG